MNMLEPYVVYSEKAAALKAKSFDKFQPRDVRLDRLYRRDSVVASIPALIALSCVAGAVVRVGGGGGVDVVGCRSHSGGGLSGRWRRCWW